MKKILNIVIIAILLLSTCSVQAAILYGTSVSSEGSDKKGYIYLVNTEEQTAKRLLDISAAELVPSTAPQIIISGDSPNGNAYDPNNRRLYFASFQDPGRPANPSAPPSELYFYDFDEPNIIVWAGSLKGSASDADFYDGKYYYISHGTNTLRSVSFKPDGTISKDGQVAIIWVTDLYTGRLYAPLWSFGDIAFDNTGLLYITGSVSDEFGNNKKYLTGTYDIKTGQFKNISGMYLGQIAFDSEGSLFCHDTKTGNILRLLNPEKGVLFFNIDVKLTDLAAYSSKEDYISNNAEDLSH